MRRKTEAAKWCGERAGLMGTRLRAGGFPLLERVSCGSCKRGNQVAKQNRTRVDDWHSMRRVHPRAGAGQNPISITRPSSSTRRICRTPCRSRQPT